MRSLAKILTVFTGTFVLLTAALTQNPRPTAQQSLRAHFASVNRSVLTMVKDFPEDKYDFRLKPGSAAIDRGVLLPTINDDFTGRAPDLGAIELGKPVPHYGPRSDVPGEVPSANTALRSWSGPLPQHGSGK